MNHKRDGLVPIAETFSGLPTPEKVLRNASPQSLQHVTRFDPVNRHLCLYALTGTNLRDPLRAGASPAELRWLTESVWTARDDCGAELHASAVDRQSLIPVETLRNAHTWRCTPGVASSSPAGDCRAAGSRSGLRRRSLEPVNRIRCRVSTC